MLLSTEQIEAELAKLPVEWTAVSEASLERVYEFPDFAKALKFVNQIGKKAEAANHHPDIQLSWGKVVVTITSHSENGLTKKDFELATEL